MVMQNSVISTEKMDIEQMEYQLQHFNFFSEEMIAENRNLIRTQLEESLIEFTDWYIKKFNITEEPAMTLRAQCNAKANDMFKDCEKPLDELSQLFRDTFTIPDNVVLPSDILHKRQYTAEQVTMLRDKVSEQDKQLRQGAVYLAMLHNEIELHEKLVPCVAAEEQLVDLAEHYLQESIVPPEDAAVVDELAEVMQDAMRG